MASEHDNPYQSPQSDADADDESIAQFEAHNEKLVTLATFDNAIDAHMLRNELRSCGIDAAVNNEASTSVLGATIVGPSRAFWIEVLIKEADAKAALLIKEQFLAAGSNEDSEIPQWQCTCGETVDPGFAVCWNCEGEYGG